MGFPYPHYDAEFLLGVVGIAIYTAVVLFVARWVPQWVGVSLMAVALVLLFAWCAWTWYRVRRG